MNALALIINTISQALIWLVIISVILSYFLDPYHPIRRGVDNIVEPLLAPIRRIVPSVGMFDFSPFILIILIQVISNLLIQMIA